MHVDGFRYQPEFLCHDDEAEVLHHLDRLTMWRRIKYFKQWSRRQVIEYGTRTYAGGGDAMPTMPPWVLALRARVAEWVGLSAASLELVTLTKYEAGSGMAYHIDNPCFGSVCTLSVGNPATYFLREPGHRCAHRLELAPRSVNQLEGYARWACEHRIAPVKALRYGLTFRQWRTPCQEAA